jgi:enterochelin esterase family protein
MKMDDKGVWSFTTGPFEPDLYVYSFSVDGVELADPGNPWLKPTATGGAESVVQVKGDKPQVWEEADVLHGTVHRHFYRSMLVGESRSFLVYTPPGYDSAAKQKYPVLYLLHGVMETEDSWVVAGCANTILDNLIAEGKSKPMLVVMPLGYGFADVPDHMADQFGGAVTQRKLMDAMGEILIQEIIPQVHKSYRVMPGPNSTAVAGCSLGGAQSVFFGLNHTDVFGYVGSLSGAFIIYGNTADSWFPKQLPSRLPKLVMACGTDDFLLRSNRYMDNWLKSKGASPTVWETPGAHTWNVWRRNLASLAPLLFR